MNDLRYFIAIILSFCIETGLNAHTKATDKNSKEKPEWVHVTHKDCLVANGIGLTLDNAKSNAENSLRNLVLDVAVDQMITNNTYFREINLKNEEARQLFRKSAYYSNFDAKNHSTFYWEKIKNRETKSKTYHYYLQYNINVEEIEKAVRKIAFDHEVSSTFKYIEEQLQTCNKVQVFNNLKKKLLTLNSKFSNNDIRKDECQELLARIENSYDNIEIKEMLNIPGKLVICQTLNDKAVFNSNPPQIKSKSIMVTNIENSEEQWIISYRYVSTQNNSPDIIHVEFNNAGYLNESDIEINMKKERIEVKLTGAPIYIKHKRMIKFYVASSYRGDAVLERIVLHYNGKQFTDSRLNQPLDGAGMYTIRYQPPQGFYKIDIGDKVSGELHYKSKISGKKEIYRFYNQDIEEIL